MPNIKPERWVTALQRVAEIERKSSILKRRFRRQKFTFSRRSAWATPAGLAVLPADQQPELPGLGHVHKRISAESLLIGKFDVETEVRLRAFYPKNSLSVRYQTGGDRNGVIRTVKAHTLVHPHAPNLMPEVFEHGTIRDNTGAYLIETTMQGQPATRQQLQELISPLAAQLHHVHQGVGINSKSLVNVVGTGYQWRWKKFVRAIELEPRTDKAVQELIARNEQLEVSLTHGDLVGSNILVSDNDFVLVDWEFADFKPIAFDMAKLIINVSDVESTLEQIQRSFNGSVGAEHSHYTLREQIALGIVLTLSWYSNHAAKAAIARRMNALNRQTTKRVNALKQLLEVR